MQKLALAILPLFALVLAGCGEIFEKNIEDDTVEIIAPKTVLIDSDTGDIIAGHQLPAAPVMKQFIGLRTIVFFMEPTVTIIQFILVT